MSSLAHAVSFDRAHLQGRTHALAAVRSRVAMGSVIAMVMVAPFERTMFTIAGLTVTTIEGVLLMAIGACLVVGVRPTISRAAAIVRPGTIFLAVVAVAAFAAPIERGNALRFTLRLMVAALTLLLVVNVVDTERRARTLVRVLLAVATLVAGIAVLEAAQVPWVLNALTSFRPGFHVVAGQLRATGTLFYPTIASMYFEVAFALGLWLLLEPSARRVRFERATVFVSLAIIAAGVAATFTRAGIIALYASLGLVAAVRLVRMPAAQAAPRILIALAAVVTGVVFVTHSPELLATRLTTEGSQAWYGARYHVPGRLSLETGRTQNVVIGLTNTGRLTWDSTREPPFFVSHHWLRADSDAVISFEGDRTAFPAPVHPGSSVTLPVSVTAPGEPGSYTLAWDVVHETRAWLSTEGVMSPRTTVTVRGARTGTVATTMDRLPAVSVRPARPQLWAAALRISAERPWLGLGPDNFRHAYGPYAGLERWDARIHANNMYLEVLTGAGVAGAMALLWLVAAAGLMLWRRCRSVKIQHLMPAAAMLAAWLVIAGHGVVDSFLTFTTTYLTFATAAGLAFSRGLSAHEEERDANRV